MSPGAIISWYGGSTTKTENGDIRLADYLISTKPRIRYLPLAGCCVL